MPGTTFTLKRRMRKLISTYNGLRGASKYLRGWRMETRFKGMAPRAGVYNRVTFEAEAKRRLDTITVSVSSYLKQARRYILHAMSRGIMVGDDGRAPTRRKCGMYADLMNMLGLSFEKFNRYAFKESRSWGELPEDFDEIGGDGDEDDIPEEIAEEWEKVKGKGRGKEGNGVGVSRSEGEMNGSVAENGREDEEEAIGGRELEEILEEIIKKVKWGAPTRGGAPGYTYRNKLGHVVRKMESKKLCAENIWTKHGRGWKSHVSLKVNSD